ncbi:SDR family NAD(P)-dependent oxidoreductase [Natronorubrum halophilum]|uniref:SDR family NAD(P)-dependent oxidoreductase n=1 Tax=Natronorubrum halophilum TaxID=1702106 RepID=UPI000EF65A06|nr:SDR family NAD(P)-dependent oxidoreductase [Natronorubrum halophilum]
MDNRVLEGQTAIVTGGAKGIGREIASTLAGEGAKVVVADVDAENAFETVSRIEAVDGEALFVKTDVTGTTSVRSMVDEALEEFGTVDILVNNAGGALDDDIAHTVDQDSWETIIDLNLTGPYTCTREVLPVMIESDGGSIVFVSSANALTGLGLPAYSAAKNGTHAFSRLIATQYGRYGVRSNAVCPGTIITESRREQRAADWDERFREQLLDQYPLQEFGTPDDVANAVLYLTSDLGRFVTGTELVVDGGLTCGLDQTFQRTLYDIDRLE